MQFSIFVSAVFTLCGISFCNAIDLDSIFDEVNTINHDFRDIFRVVSQQVFRKDDAQPIIEVRKFVDSATEALNAASGKIGSDSTVDDPADVVAAFCDDMDVFTNTQMKTADILVFKANNMRDAVDGTKVADSVVRLSSAYDKYANNMIPLGENCSPTHVENIYIVKSTLHRALADLKPKKRRT